MQSELFQKFIDSISLLTAEQNGIVKNTLSAVQITCVETVEITDSGVSSSESSSAHLHTSSTLEKNILSAFAEHPQCPSCKGHHIGLWGVRNGRQRYRCKTCKSTFNAFSNTPLSRLRYPEKWDKYLTGMTHSETLRTAAGENEINLESSFRWRHRFLEVINDDQADELCDITEIDTTFFRESFKGQRNPLPRPTRKRGNDPNKARRVPVMAAIPAKHTHQAV